MSLRCSIIAALVAAAAAAAGPEGTEACSDRTSFLQAESASFLHGIKEKVGQGDRERDHGQDRDGKEAMVKVNESQSQEPIHVGPTRIPCIIHQTWKTHTLSAPQSSYAETWQTMNPMCEYRLWNDTEIALLAEEKSPDLIWPIWDGFTPVEKADVFRYLVLWAYGGYYADADVEPNKAIADWEVSKDASLIVGYEFGHRFPEWQRAEIKFGRTEQFQQWFIVSAPGNPVLLRCMQMIRRRFTWKIQSTLDLTGPGVFSDAVHEFLEENSDGALVQEIGFRKTPPDHHYLSFPSETLYGQGEWKKVWVCAAGRVNASPQVGRDDPDEGKEPLIIHHFAGSWKTDKDRTPEELAKMSKGMKSGKYGGRGGFEHSF